MIDWKESLRAQSPLPRSGGETIISSPSPNKSILSSDPIITPSPSPKTYRSLHSLMPTSAGAITASGFPALDPEAAKTYM